MIFDCGEVWDAKVERLGKWHPFFPWFPRQVDVVNGRAVCVAFQWIERRGVYVDGLRHSYWAWHYRLPELTDTLERK